MKILHALFVAFVFCAAPVLAREPVVRTDTPAIWTVKGAKGKVYLFGSLHVMPPNIPWRSPEVTIALEQSDVVVFEIDLAAMADPKQSGPVVERLGMLPPGQELKSVLPRSLYAELGRVCIDLGVPREALSTLRPWMAALQVSVQSIANLGFDPYNGVDPQMYAWAKSKGKSFGALETLESQLSIFADLKRAEEIQFLDLTLRQVRETPKMIYKLLGAYRDGDTATLDKVMNAGFESFPNLRNRVLRDRNAAWVPQIEKMLEDGRTHMVVVGVGHLVGPDSVVAMLRAKNFQVDGPETRPVRKRPGPP